MEKYYVTIIIDCIIYPLEGIKTIKIDGIEGRYYVENNELLFVNDDIDEYKVLIKELPIGNDIEYILLKNLIEHPKNYVRAIKNLPLYFLNQF